MRYILTNAGEVIDLQSKEVSSWQYVPYEEAVSDEWGCEEAFYEIYYYNRDKGEHLETDNKGGTSMTDVYASQILKTADTIKDLADEFVTNNRLIDLFDTCFQYQSGKGQYPGRGCFYPLDILLKQPTFAAVWTNKGLQYVAKLNKQKQFELL